MTTCNFQVFVRRDFMTVTMERVYNCWFVDIFLALSTKQFCSVFILVVSVCLCGLDFHGTTSAHSVLFYMRKTQCNCRLLSVYVHLSAILFFPSSPTFFDSTIKITFRKLPSPNHYGTFAANYPENVFLVPKTIIWFSPARGREVGWLPDRDLYRLHGSFLC